MPHSCWSGLFYVSNQPYRKKAPPPRAHRNGPGATGTGTGATGTGKGGSRERARGVTGTGMGVSRERARGGHGNGHGGVTGKGKGGSWERARGAMGMGMGPRERARGACPSPHWTHSLAAQNGASGVSGSASPSRTRTRRPGQQEVALRGATGCLEGRCLQSQRQHSASWEAAGAEQAPPRHAPGSRSHLTVPGQPPDTRKPVFLV